MKRQKYIFITGGVVSGLGKGISGSSFATILKNSNYKIFMQKLDPYLNIDPGTMNPFEHGEVYVTCDGAETDLDLGHYERFIDQNLTQQSNITAGKIYQTVLSNERKGLYNGSTVQVIPHITDEIKKSIYNCNKEADIVITEIGGTVGDIESLPFLEAVRQIIFEQGSQNTMICHVGLLPYISASQEYKTKPIQHSVKQLQSLGLQPDCIIARSKTHLTEKAISKISRFCNVDQKNVIAAYDAPSIYEVPLNFAKQNIHEIVAKKLALVIQKPNMANWKKFHSKIENASKILTIGLVGKYTSLPDAYLSVIESLNIAGYEKKCKIHLKWVESSSLKPTNLDLILGSCSGILIPGGFGTRGVEGKILAAGYARRNQIPFLGLCLGMQVAVIEFARNVCGLEDANSTEFNPKTKHDIFGLVKGKKYDDDLGGTLRLGNYLCHIKPNSLAAKLYKKSNVLERHRHRYEFNNNFLELLESRGLEFSGIWKKGRLMEISELPSHPFFIGSQFHPEFTSRPNKPNPLFQGFIQACKTRKVQTSYENL